MLPRVLHYLLQALLEVVDSGAKNMEVAIVRFEKPIEVSAYDWNKLQGDLTVQKQYWREALVFITVLILSLPSFPCCFSVRICVLSTVSALLALNANLNVLSGRSIGRHRIFIG